MTSIVCILRLEWCWSWKEEHRDTSWRFMKLVRIELGSILDISECTEPKSEQLWPQALPCEYPGESRCIWRGSDVFGNMPYCLKKVSSEKESTVFFFLIERIAISEQSRLTTLQKEGSFNKDLSSALLQKRDKGIQLVHFISRTITDFEKTFTRIERDGVAIKWAKERLAVPA